MVDDERSDGVRLGQLLSSEIHGHERGSLGRLSVVDADTDVEPTADGAFAFAVAFDDHAGTESRGVANQGERAERIAEVYVRPEQVRVEFTAARETAARAADDEGLRAERVAGEPQRALVFVTNGAEVKDALRVVRRVAEDLRQDST